MQRESGPSLPSTTHIFSVDVEEYFHVHAFESAIRRDQWPSLPSRVAANVDLILEMLAEHDATGTFFVLGWIADRHPGVVRRIAEAGHEIASHGWWHYRVNTLQPSEFRDEVRASKALLEDISGQAVTGFRAPSFSITPDASFAFEILLEEGYLYDSSVFPIWRPNYGTPGAPPIPHVKKCAAGSLIEFPLATSLLGPFRVPAAGGGYFRQLPLSLVQRAFREHGEWGIPGMFYIHPWELDPEQPRMRCGPLTRIRHYRGLKKSRPNLECLLREFRFTSVARRLSEGRVSVSLELPTKSVAS